MTDLNDEWWTQRSAIEQARERGGDVLITGLGLGLVVTSILEPPGGRVKRVLVIERSADVIGLVAPSLESCYDGRFEVINADAFEWLPPPGQRFSVAWHDIWPNPHEPGLRSGWSSALHLTVHGKVTGSGITVPPSRSRTMYINSALTGQHLTQ